MQPALAVIVPATDFRNDLVEKISALLCAPNGALNSQSLWQSGIYAAQLDGRLYEPYQGAAITDDFLELQARRQAQEFHHNSIAYGHCRSGKAWYVTAPAPELNFKMSRRS